MKRFITICQVEFVLFIRDFFGFFFTLVFPTMMLVLFGSIYGRNRSDVIAVDFGRIQRKKDIQKV